MRGVLSFHPVDPGFFETVVEPLLRGEKVNPEAFLGAALQVRRAARLTLGYKRALALLLEQLEPPPPVDEGTLWDRVRTRLERLDYKVPALSRVVHAAIEPALHLDGRPFLISEASPERVAESVARYLGATREGALLDLVRDQLRRWDAGLARELVPEEVVDPTSDAAYRNGLLGDLRKIHDWGQARLDEREGKRSARGAEESADERRWHIVHLHSRAVPFWVARDVDGLATICDAAGIDPPLGLGSAAGLFAGSRAEFPELGAGLTLEAQGPRDLGAYAAPREVPELLAFLAQHGGRLIQVATRHGQGPLCTLLLHKIRECLQFAERHGVGYLEASGIYPPLELPAETADATELVSVSGR